jgi:hypothetical protein
MRARSPCGATQRRTFAEKCGLEFIASYAGISVVVN